MGIFTVVRPTITDPVIISGFPLDMDDWSCSEWIEYYTRIKDTKGKAEAERIVSLDSGRVGWLADLGWCRFNCEFINFFESEGIESDTGILSGAICSVSDIVKGVGEVGETTAKTLKFLIPALLITGTIIGGVFVTKELRKNKKKKK